MMENNFSIFDIMFSIYYSIFTKEAKIFQYHSLEIVLYQFKIHDAFFMFQFKEDISRFLLVTSFMASLLQVSIQMFLGRDNQKELSVQGHPDGGETMYIISKDFGHSLPQLLHFLQNR